MPFLNLHADFRSLLSVLHSCFLSSAVPASAPASAPASPRCSASPLLQVAFPFSSGCHTTPLMTFSALLHAFSPDVLQSTLHPCSLTFDASFHPPLPSSPPPLHHPLRSVSGEVLFLAPLLPPMFLPSLPSYRRPSGIQRRSNKFSKTKSSTFDSLFS